MLHASKIVLLGLGATMVAAFTGQMTYTLEGNAVGSCGVPMGDGQPIAAIASSYFTSANPNNDPMCHRQILITYGGKSTTATVLDKCPSCDSNHIDVSEAVFQHFAGLGVGVLQQVNWKFI